MEMTSEQQYWSLNGSFEALYRISNCIDTGEVTNLSELKTLLIANMTTVNEKMTVFEDTI
ncbi:hypothetical protein BSK59_13345 [Paenibacillus odorifer]|uniref:hypothetical protein n=1 Tax=Paenibacillus odorifer TaxID=189426 RepID=UPI00096E869E|nr:hypothetical protein [Paenibacillus odorifer]OME55457.1 hypothetical protein BSK59_13345 [Paenibacillus odorifer]